MATGEHQIDLVALLGSVPVEGAVFTTFTLSLSWFEVYLLRRLERQGARRVAILADVEGVAMSLREGLARGPGLRYGLESIRLAGGTFHPKVALAWGGERIVLAVGSGNLTLPGMQRNLECWDVLVHGWRDVPARAQLSRSVASGVDGFLATLASKLDAGAWTTGLLAQARAVLGAAGSSLPERDDVWWLDSGRRPIGEQVVEVMGTAPRQLEFLSPFHDPSGVAVLDLARQTGVSGLTLLYADDTAFPLARARREWPGGIGSRAIVAKARPLHAKVYRWRSAEESWLLSGSANATRAALWTTNNVEACLLRRAPRGAWDTLLASTAGTPLERPPPPPVAAAAPLRILHARASERGVAVRLETTASRAPATVRVSYLESECEETLAWSGGAVLLRLPSDHDPLRPTPLRVEAEAEIEGVTVRARAWVSFEAWLEASPSWRRVVSAWARLLRNEGDDEEEEIELLSVFAEEHGRTLGTLGAVPRRAGGGDGGTSKDSDIPVPVRLLNLAANRDHVSGELGAGSASPSTIDGVLAAMRSAFRALGEPAARSGDADDDSDAAEAPPPRQASQRARDALDAFEQRFLDHSRSLSGRPASASRVLAYAGLCARIALRLRARDERRDLIWRTADRWVRALLLPRAAGAPLLSVLSPPDAETPREVLAWFAGLVAALLWRADGGRLDGDVSLATDRSLLGAGPLREALATLRRFEPDVIARAAFPGEMARMMVDPPSSPSALLAAASAAPAPSDRMRWLLNLARGGAARRPLAALETDAEAAGLGALTADEQELLREARRDRPPVVAFPWAQLCPACGGTLSVVTRSRLGGRAPARCTSMRCAVWVVPSEGA